MAREKKQKQERAEQLEEARENIRPRDPDISDEERSGNQLRVTDYSEVEREIEEKEGPMAARTAHEMSLHDQLSRTPRSDKGASSEEDEDEDGRE